ncbi:MAG: restriction endonuclease [Chloroflexi bacterium]|nr:restriction endonuclease [Chloroflexota bacterium]
MNPMEREYTARCATIREILALIGLIERGDKGPAWRLLPKGEAITRQELAKTLKESSFVYLPGANGGYRGNAELEEVGKGTQPAKAGAAAEAMAGHTNANVEGEPGEQGEVTRHGSAAEETDDLSLCLAVLQVLPDEEGEYLSEEQIMEAVSAKLQIPAAYLSQPSPPWGRKVARSESLLHFRLEHVYRALSIPQTALIRDGGLDFPDAGRTWFLTSKGREVVRTEDTVERRDKLQKLVNRYWSTHSYEGWQNEPWMERVIELLEEAGNDGTPFEHLCATLLEKMRDVDVAEVQSSGYLDESGVDIVVKMAKGRTAMLGTVPIHSVQRDAVILVQCKRWLHNDVPSDVVSKLFGFTARLRAQATGGELRYDVDGGRLIIFGNLTRDATWTYWWLREMWHQAEHTAMGHLPGVHGGQSLAPNQRAPRWELWDGGRVFDMIRKYEVGVKKNVDGEYVADEEYFRDLPRGKVRRAKA